MHKTIPTVVVSLFALSVLGGCLHNIDPTSTPSNGDPVDTMGTVTFVDLSGGFFGIVADDGTEYLPLNLEAGYEKDGLRVEFKGSVRTDMATIYQWGISVEISDIAFMDTGTITFVDLEGGFYGIVTSDGAEYLPLNLDPGFEQDGLRVDFTAQFRTDIATTMQWGTPVDIVKMEAQ